MSSDPGLSLHDSIVTPLQLGKILRELFALDDFLTASNHASSKLPFTSRQLQSMAQTYDLNLLTQEDREQLKKRLSFVRRTAPSVRISFASAPSPQALRVLVRWFRENGHPNTLITVSVQPSIAGGCIVHTSNKEFDFSLQQLFKQNRLALAQRFV